tara:strand:- start:9769 stop:11487 length:1719 start_codon:yes stop_codon:yes gene_type:complete
MPSVSKKQQKFMGIVRAIQKGDQPASKFSKDARDAAKKMKKKDVKKFAKTKHDGLPTKVRQEIEEYVDDILDGMGEEFMVNEEKECMCEACQKGYMTHPTRKTKVMFGKRYRNCIKKESTKAYADTLNKIANDKKMKMISKKDKALLTKIAKLMKKQKSVKLRGKSGMGTISHFGMPESVDEGRSQVAMYTQEFDKLLKKQTKGKSPTIKDLERVYGLMRKRYKELDSRKYETVDEGKYSKIMKAVRKGPKSGPWQIIVSKNNKVVKEVPVRTLQLIPAHYDDIKKAYPNHKIGIEAKDGKIVYREWVVNIKEGSCGYGIDGQLGEVPAGPHLLKKKKKKKDEVSLGGRMAKKIGKHGGTRDKGEIAKILKLLIKRGNKKKDAMDMINKNYDRVSKAYRKASPAKKAEILSSLQESVNEGGMELKKLEDAIKMFQKKIKKQGRVTNARDEDHLENLIKIYKQMGGKKIKESVNERMDKRQAGEMLKQLGGNKFIAMTGAKNFAVGPKGASFKIGRNSKNVNYVRIDLKNDLYDMEFIQMRAGKMKVKSKVKQIYADQLQQMFTKHTGMYTSL